MPIQLRGVAHHYGESEEGAGVDALIDVNLDIEAGAFAVLMGPSGSGKSTLLNLIGGIDRPSAGSLLLGSTDTAKLDEKALTLLRRSSIGYVFQFFNLVPTLTVEENIAFPLALQKRASKESSSRVREVLGQIALTPRAKHYPNQLSGGEMQRVAIGRAIVHRPDLILADEPTGNLDTVTGERILSLLKEVHAGYQPTIVMATHSDRAAAIGDYVVEVIDGRVRRGAAAT